MIKILLQLFQLNIFCSMFMYINSFAFRNTRHEHNHGYFITKMMETTEPTKATKTVCISPGGFKGVYMFGTCSYIKHNYKTSDIMFEGTSAGAWNALFMVSHKQIPFEMIDICIQHNHKIIDIEKSIKKTLLHHYSTNDFDLNRLIINVATLQKFKLTKTSHTQFNNLEDAIDACISSSHIPFITGGCVNYYKNKLSFDGGVFKPKRDKNHVLHITPDIWKKCNKCEITTLFSKHHYEFNELFMEGYLDAEKNKHYLDTIFTQNDM